MGRCVISALGEMLISILSAATWMDEHAPPTQHPAHLPLGVSGPSGRCRGDACDQQAIVSLSPSSLVYLPVPHSKQLPPQQSWAGLQDTVWVQPGSRVASDGRTYKYGDLRLSSQETA